MSSKNAMKSTASSAVDRATHSSAGGTIKEKRDVPLLGISLLLVATILFAWQDVITKQLTASVSVSQIMLVRFAAFALFALIYAHRKVGITAAVKSALPKWQVLRCFIMCTEIGLFAYAIQFLGVAEIHAIFSCFPLIITALSVPLLGEQVGWRRWLAVCIGFIGTLIILQPGTGVFNPAALLALVCVLMYSFYNILTRKVSRQDSFETSLLYFGVVGLIASLIAVYGRWQSPDAHTALLLCGICITSVSAHLLLIKALEVTSAVVLQPFNYFILVWAIVLGYLVFGEVLALHQVLGAGIVVASGLYVGVREYLISRQRTVHAPTG